MKQACLLRLVMLASCLVLLAAGSGSGGAGVPEGGAASAGGNSGDAGSVAFLRTPDERFASLSDFPFETRYVDIDGLRMAYVDEGPAAGRVVLLLHGVPTWSYLYRRMIPVLVGAGFRVVAPDLIGFGRSDKPVERSAHTYAGHVRWVTEFIERVGLDDIILFVHDWGGLIGLRVAAEHPDRFARLVIANTALPEGEPLGGAFMVWQRLSQAPFLDCGLVVQRGTARELTLAEVDAYRAPFPDERYLAGPRQLPLLVPTGPDDPTVPANRAAWEVLAAWTKPVLTLWAPDDPMLGMRQADFVERIPGAAAQPHQTFSPAGHFIQEDFGLELAAAIVGWLRADIGALGDSDADADD